MPFEVSGLNVNISAHCHLREYASTANAPSVPTAPPPPGIPVPSNKVIQKDQPFQVLFHWSQSGSGTWALAAGIWELEVFVEKMGSGETTAIQDNAFKSAAGGNPNPGFYAKALNIAPGTLNAGVYRLVCSMQLKVAGVPRALAGFHDMGLIRVIDEA